MNPYIFPTICSVCGGEGMLHASDVGADWLGEVRHNDPKVCAENLRRKRANLDKEKKELEQKKQAS